MPFWKSAPYLAHFMHGYRFHELVVEALGTAGPPDQIVDALQRYDAAFPESGDATVISAVRSTRRNG